VKVESFNPMASVKDRLAYAIIKDARDSGALKPGQTVIEATSGNTGIALAMVCAVMGHPFVAVMVETFSIERRKLMRALGGKVILTPAAERGTGMVSAQKHWLPSMAGLWPINSKTQLTLIIMPALLVRKFFQILPASVWTIGLPDGVLAAPCLVQEEP